MAPYRLSDNNLFSLSDFRYFESSFCDFSCDLLFYFYSIDFVTFLKFFKVEPLISMLMLLFKLWARYSYWVEVF